MESILSFIEQIDGNPYFLFGGLVFAFFYLFVEFFYWRFRCLRGRRLYIKILTDLKNDCHLFNDFDSCVYFYFDNLSRFDKLCILNFLSNYHKSFYTDVCTTYILIDFDDRFNTKGV